MQFPWETSGRMFACCTSAQNLAQHQMSNPTLVEDLWIVCTLYIGATFGATSTVEPSSCGRRHDLWMLYIANLTLANLLSLKPSPPRPALEVWPRWAGTALESDPPTQFLHGTTPGDIHVKKVPPPQPAPEKDHFANTPEIKDYLT